MEKVERREDLRGRHGIPTCGGMGVREKWFEAGRNPAVRTGLFALGVLCIVVSPAVGILPGPGGVIVFGFGLGLILKYSDWAKRRYVRFKRAHPNKGRWADWGLRRRSARRRERLRREQEGAAGPTGGEPAAEARPLGD